MAESMCVIPHRPEICHNRERCSDQLGVSSYNISLHYTIIDLHCTTHSMGKEVLKYMKLSH